MPGLGKTTLAKLIYHESDIDRHFHEKIWVCVSTPFEVKTILRGIVESLELEKATIHSKDAICKCIRENLEKKRYLLVLDDVWSEDPEKWKELRSCLLTVKDTQGSSIIVTTRSDKVAKVMETLPRCDLRKLSDVECWLIMKDKAVSVGSAPLSKEQETTGKEIAKKCGGVPLMAKSVGLLSRAAEYWFRNGGVWEGVPYGLISGFVLYITNDEDGRLVVNGVRSERVDLRRKGSLVHVMDGVLMDAEFQQSVQYDGEED
ncbi:putative disease resistance protein RGA3 [Rosa chinensis]|uniref:putative disease resistance protein RGA3 n=1 Tax=Rosa chinensis TaxID=74649 RepID=UPI000D089927|nr:putative disease resistance protein RGA3 [Rosa chinensis]